MPAVEQLQQATSLDDVLAAAERIRPHVHRTPVFKSRLFDDAAGTQTFFKCENLQRGGAFKARGAFNFLLQLKQDERRRGVVAFSSGNHAQAVAIAAATLGVKATIVMPADAPKSKIEATRAYGPEIVFYERIAQNREQIAFDIAAKTGAAIVPPYDHPWILTGQGTAAVELLEQVPDLDTIAVPLGGGGLFSGTLIASKALRPGIRVYGVEPESADDWHQSLQRDEIVRIGAAPTIADGLRTLAPGKFTFEIGRSLGDGVLLVSEQQIKATVRLLLTRLKLLVEPSGAVAAAALLHGIAPAGSKRVGAILSGGNIDLTLLAEICREEN